MDKRLPSRLRDIRQEIIAVGGTCSSESVVAKLCGQFPEYNRLKRPALKRLAAQELVTPLPPAMAAAAQAVAGDDDDEDALSGSNRKNKKKRKRAAGEQSEGGADELENDANATNSALRKMYNPEATEAPAAGAAGGGRTTPTAKERAAMKAARRDAGLDPRKDGMGGTSTFVPEDRPEERLEDLGGIDRILDELRQLVVYPCTHPEVFSHLGVQPPTGVLLHGPPGTGKTKLAHALAGTTGVNFFKVAATEIVSGMSGESEAKIRQLFAAAIASAPSLLFLDEIDSITPRRDSAGREMERRIVAQMLTCMDELQNKFVVVIGATNRPDALDPALRRAGRFDREISMGIPDEPARARILTKMTSGMRLSGDIDVLLLARLTPGYVGADLLALAKEAALTAISRAFATLGQDRLCGTEDGPPVPFSAEELDRLSVEMDDFKEALKRVQPSARREGFTTVPDVTWDDVGALGTVRTELDAAVCEPIRKADLFKQLGLTVPVGVLLFGPPGCGKTLLAKAAANASGANFIAVKGPELLNKYVGESERAVRLVFQRALSSAPCVIFFDELDALVPKRTGEGSSGAERVVNQMLTEMDGVNERSQVFVIAATNRPDIIDPAMLRPGRLDRLLYVPLPTVEGRVEILRTHARNLPLSDDVDLDAIAKSAEGFSGADLAGLVRESAYLAIRNAKVPAIMTPAATTADGEAGEAGQTEAAPALTVEDLKVTGAIMAMARSRVSASVGPEERKEYAALELKLASGKS